MKILQFHHLCIQTHDYKKSLEFYQHTLGFELIKESPNFHNRDMNSWLKAGGIMIELQTAKAGESLNTWSNRNAGPVHFCLVVEDVEQAYSQLLAQGNVRFKDKQGETLYQVENSKLFKIYAPEGTEVEIRDEPRI